MKLIHEWGLLTKAFIELISHYFHYKTHEYYQLDTKPHIYRSDSKQTRVHIQHRTAVY